MNAGFYWTLMRAALTDALAEAEQAEKLLIAAHDRLTVRARMDSARRASRVTSLNESDARYIDNNVALANEIEAFLGPRSRRG